MATPHLTKSSSGSPKPLNSLDGPQGKHLLIIRNTTAYNNTEMVCKPVDEWFVAAASWGNSSYYSSNVSTYIASDAAVVINNLSNKLSTCSWTHGHKAIFSYAARSGCPGRVVWQPSTVTTTILQRYLEFGISRHLLEFDTFFMPMNNFSSFRAYVRVFFPSFIQTLADGFNTAMAFNFSYNNFTQLRYRFFDAMPSVGDLGSGYGSLDIIGDANHGEGTSGGAQTSNSWAYDPWNVQTNSGASPYYDYGQLQIYYWADLPSSVFPNQSYFDYEITDANVLAQLKSAMHTHRHVWMLCGFNLGNGLSGSATYGAQQGSRVLSYITQVQLVFKVSSAKFNQ